MAAETSPDSEQGHELEEDWALVRSTRLARHERPLRHRRPVLVILAVTALAGGLRFYHLSTPHGFVFDEVYYAKDGCLDAGFDFRMCHLETPNEQTATVHPPLGRWIIAGGIRVFSKPSDFDCTFGTNKPARCNPFGFRVMPATFGTLSVMLAAILAWRLFASALWTFVAGLLLATESMNFVQSRVAMLDILVTTFVLAGFLFLVLDRQWVERKTPGRAQEAAERGEEEEAAEALLGLPPDRPPAPIWRPWRVASGLAFGAAVATKWSGIPAALAAIVLSYAWERTRRKRVGLSHPIREAVRDESFGIFVFLLLLPLAVYVASYAKWFADHRFNVHDWWALQRSMADFSLKLRAKHPYASRAWTWLPMVRPVSYYYQGTPKTSAAILGMGNPAIFWSSLLTIPYVLWAWVAKRDWRGGFIFVAFAFQYLPWFFAARTDFLFYMAPMTPFMVLAGVYALKDLSEVRIGTDRVRALAPVAGFLVIVSLAMFAFFFPILTARVIPYSAWHERMWFQTWI